MPDIKASWTGVDIQTMGKVWAKFSICFVLGILAVVFALNAAAASNECYVSSCQTAILLAWMLTGFFGVPAVLLLISVLADINAGKAGAIPGVPGTSARHEVLFDPKRGLYWCRGADCGFQVSVMGNGLEAARAHAKQPAIRTKSVPVPPSRPDDQARDGVDATASRNAAAAPVSTIGIAQTSPSAGFKTCPECAEEVRQAARKCRFCGFRFDSPSGVESGAASG